MIIAPSRRSLFKLAAVGAAGLAAPQIMIRAASAQVSAPEIGNPGFNRLTLGSFEVTTILDGGRAGDSPHPTFGENQSAEDLAKVLAEEKLPADRFVNTFTPALVNTGSELVLFDTGLGESGREGGMGMLAERMAASGYKPEDVTVVVITHMHGDHIGGLTEGEGPAFANARYVAGQAEYDFWSAPDRMSGATENGAKAVQAKVVPLAEKMTFLEDGAEVVPGITAIAAFGHTPGHLIFRVESDGRQLVLAADTANHYVASLRRPDWHVRFDMDKDAAAETRKRVFDMLAADGLPFIGYHMPFPAVGFVEKLETGYRFIPNSYHLTL